MPLPGTKVIPDGWSEHHRPTATGGMTATCFITRTAGDGTTTPGGDWEPAAATTIYSGPCRVTSPPFSREQLVPAPGAQDTLRRYGVFVRWDAEEFAVGDHVEITDARDDLLIGKVFRVVDISYGSEQWQRNLACEEFE